MDWIWANKEWLFAGVGLVVLSVFWKALARLREHARPPPLRRSDIIDAAPAPGIPVEPALDDPAAIFKAINAAPPFQRADVERHYRGLKVDWTGIMKSAQPSEGKKEEVQVLFECSGQMAMFDVDPNMYPGLSLLHAGARLRISGVIERVFTLYIRLIDVRLLEY